MVEKDFNQKTKEIAERAKQARKRETSREKVRRKKEKEQKVADAESKASQKQKGSTIFTAVIVTELEYEGANIPSREQLAEDLGSIIMKWVSNKSFYAVGSKEAIPTLISIDVDIR